MTITFYAFLTPITISFQQWMTEGILDCPGHSWTADALKCIRTFDLGIFQSRDYLLRSITNCTILLKSEMITFCQNNRLKKFRVRCKARWGTFAQLVMPSQLVITWLKYPKVKCPVFNCIRRQRLPWSVRNIPGFDKRDLLFWKGRVYLFIFRLF